MNPAKHRLAVILTVAVAGAASMATSPPDDGRDLVSQSFEAPMPSFELTDEAPEAAFVVWIASTTSTTTGARVNVKLALQTEADVEIVASLSQGDAPGDFSAKTIAGFGEMEVSTFAFDPATLRVRKLGPGRVTGGGQVTISGGFSERLDTSGWEVAIEPK